MFSLLKKGNSHQWFLTEKRLHVAWPPSWLGGWALHISGNRHGAEFRSQEARLDVEPPGLRLATMSNLVFPSLIYTSSATTSYLQGQLRDLSNSCTEPHIQGSKY